MHAPRFFARALVSAALLLAAGSLTAQANVWTVDANGPADFSDVQSAVDAASSGDLIVIEGGAYENVVIDGKGVTLIGDPGVGVIDLTPVHGETQPALTIRNLPADEVCIVSGFQVFLGHDGPPAALDIDECAGAVWLQDLFVDSYGAAALRVRASSSVQSHNSFFQTNAVAALPDGTPRNAPGAHLLDNSELYGYVSQFRGSHGSLQLPTLPVPNAPGNGGDGVIVDDSFAQLSGGFSAGASGPSLLVDGCTLGGDGGNGLVLANATAFAILRDIDVGGGFGGFFDTTCAPPSQMGEQIQGSAANAQISHATAREFHAPARISPGQTLDLLFEGDAGDLAFLFLANRPALAGNAAGITLHLEPTSLKLLTTLPMPAGSRSLSLPVPALPPGVTGVLVPLQAAMLASKGSRHETGPRALAVL